MRHRLIRRHSHATAADANAQRMAGNMANKIEERLACWLLMARDRTDSDELTLTHEFLALMLGTQRPGVTIALHLLERAGLITTKRAPSPSLIARHWKGAATAPTPRARAERVVPRLSDRRTWIKERAKSQLRVHALLGRAHDGS